jgi:hypothetical protein
MYMRVAIEWIDRAQPRDGVPCLQPRRRAGPEAAGMLIRA